MNQGEIKGNLDYCHFLRLRDGNLCPLNIPAFRRVPIPEGLVRIDEQEGLVFDLTHGPSEEQWPPGEFVCGD